MKKLFIIAGLLLPILAMASAGGVFRIIANDGTSDKMKVANKVVNTPLIDVAVKSKTPKISLLESEEAKNATLNSPTIDDAIATIKNKAVEKGYAPGTISVTRNSKDGSATVTNSATGASYTLVPVKTVDVTNTTTGASDTLVMPTIPK